MIGEISEKLNRQIYIIPIIIIFNSYFPALSNTFGVIPQENMVRTRILALIRTN